MDSGSAVGTSLKIISVFVSSLRPAVSESGPIAAETAVAQIEKKVQVYETGTDRGETSRGPTGRPSELITFFRTSQ